MTDEVRERFQKLVALMEREIAEFNATLPEEKQLVTVRTAGSGIELQRPGEEELALRLELLLPVSQVLIVTRPVAKFESGTLRVLWLEGSDELTLRSASGRTMDAERFVAETLHRLFDL